jgi:sugar transferase (PEP-CTERM/EpsH1 system associated)
MLRDPAPSADARPLVAHVVHRFDVGGLENGVVNLINRMPTADFRHAVIALTEITSFRERVLREDVSFHALRKGAGHGVRVYPQLVRLFRALKPAIVHTRNLAALEASAPAWLAGVPARVHGEHGWDVADLVGSRVKYRLVRRLYRPFVHRYVALSQGLESYLVDAVGVPRERVVRICNGVDTARFSPPPVGARAPIPDSPFDDPRFWVVGTVGRLGHVKDQVTLARAFVRVLAIAPGAASRVRLAIVGEGPLRKEIENVLAQAGATNLAWLPGERGDVPAILRGLDCFVLPSRAEGISNTILEAMASGLPVIATRVGGNPELVEDGVTGALVPPEDPQALAREIVACFRSPQLAAARGRAGRARAEQSFSLDGMVRRYGDLYGEVLRATGKSTVGTSSVARAR